MFVKTKKILVCFFVAVGALLCACAFAACEKEHVHSFPDFVVTVQPTCTKSGLKERVCGDCGETEKEEIPPTGHKYGEWFDSKKADCTTDGERARICSACGDVQTEAVPALSHDFGEWETLVSPDCTAAGERKRVCRRCDFSERETVPALSHDFVHYERLAPTCTENGHEAYDVCKRCGESTRVDLPATGHTFSEEWSHDDSGHFHAVLCGHESAVVSRPHVFKGGVCTVCDFAPNYTAGLEFVSVVGGYAVSRGSAVGDIVVPDLCNGLPVVAVNASGFDKCGEVTSVKLGKFVVSIEESAFRGCGNLTEINLEGVEYFGERAFADCVKLREVVLDSAVALGEFVFEGCDRLTSVAVPAAATSIGRGAFYRCSLTEITLPFIGERADGSVTHFGHVFGALQASTNKELVPTTLKKAVILGGTTLADRAFYACTGLTSITLPSTLVSVEKGALEATNITDAVLPSVAVKALDPMTAINVTVTGDVGADMFKGFTALKSVKISGAKIVASRAFAGVKTLETVEFSKGLETVLDYAFDGCSALEAIDLPSGVKSISNFAFSGCESALRVVIPETVTFIGASAFQNCRSLVSVSVPEGIDNVGSGTFWGCSSLETVTLPSTLEKVPTSLFYGCVSLASIDLPSGITSIGGGAFEGCSRLASIEVPSGVASIGRGAFGGCSALVEITLPFVGGSIKAATDYSQYPFGYVFYSRTEYEGCTPTVQKYHNWDMTALDGETVYGIPSSLETVNITGGNVLSGAFWNCAGIKKVTLGAAVVDIEREAFHGCTALGSVEFESKDGWSVRALGASSGLAVDVGDPAENAARLTGAYLDFGWRRDN